jgi:hypothetical protein
MIENRSLSEGRAQFISSSVSPLNPHDWVHFIVFFLAHGIDMCVGFVEGMGVVQTLPSLD